MSMRTRIDMLRLRESFAVKNRLTDTGLNPHNVLSGHSHIKREGKVMSMYYSLSIILTFMALFYFIIGMRGCGKTYACKKFVIEQFLKDGVRFIYLRRYKEELKDLDTFFDDLIDEFPDHKLELKGRKFYIDDKLAGQAKTLSTTKIAGKGVPFPLVKYIIFDEFIIDKGVYHYLPDEVDCFLNFYESIARTRKGVKVFFLSNAISQTNPYFLYFKLRLPKAKNGIYCHDNKLVQMVESEEFKEFKKNTDFGKLVKGTPYERYAIDNEFYRDNDTFIEKKSDKARYYMALVYNNYKIGVWVDWQAGCFYCSNDYDPSNKVVYSLTQADHSVNTILIKSMRNNKYMKIFTDGYKNGKVRFEHMQVKNIMMEVFSALLF